MPLHRGVCAMTSDAKPPTSTPRYEHLGTRPIAVGDTLYTVGVTLSVKDCVFTVHHGHRSLKGTNLREVLHDMRRVLLWEQFAEIKGQCPCLVFNTESREIELAVWEGWESWWANLRFVDDEGAYNHEGSGWATEPPNVPYQLRTERAQELVERLFLHRLHLKRKIEAAQAELVGFVEETREMLEALASDPATTSAQVEEALERFLGAADDPDPD